MNEIVLQMFKKMADTKSPILITYILKDMIIIKI